MTGSDSAVSGYDLVIFDLDGVVFLGHDPIDGAVESINRLVGGGTPVAYATNNASRSADDVAKLLVSLGITARADEVITSAQASAKVLADRLSSGDTVLVVGGPALRGEVTAVGLKATAEAGDKPKAVVQGYAADVGWTLLAEASVAIRAGAIWVATNADRTLPSPRGPLPGNGSLVAALAHALERQPDVIVGKPAPALFEAAAAKIGARKPLVVGDRLDTDIAGGVQAGMDSMLVLTGVSTARDVIEAVPAERPTWVSADLRGMDDGAVRVPVKDSDRTSAEAGGWTVRRTDAGLELDGDGTPAAALAALAAVSWAGRGDAEKGDAENDGENTEGAEPTPIVAANAQAKDALAALHLSD